MDESQKREAQLAAVRELKEKGVTGIKLELEGTMQRRSVQGSYERCETCGGDGSHECEHCDGLGWQTDDEGYETDDECEHCEANGRINCNDCQGAGRKLQDGKVDFSNDNVAFKWFINTLAKKLDMRPENLRNTRNWAADIFPWMSYAKLYYDGSVDTEITFTVRLDNEENIFIIPKVLEVFNEMAEVVGHGLDVRGAGMHMALIFERDCRYPDTEAFPFGSTEVDNFVRATTQLLPAMYFLATATGRSRALNYRPPVVGGSGKHTAVGFNGGAIEFRIFDTCYERPEAALDNIVVIKNLMKYMSRKYVSPGIAKELGRDTIDFGNELDQTLGRLYVTADQIGALYAGLPKIMPEYYTLDDLIAQRKFNRKLGDAAEVERQQREQCTQEYAEYEERFEWQIKARELERRGMYTRQLVENTSSEEFQSMSSEDIKKRVENLVKDDVKRFKANKIKAERYIADRMARLNNQGRGQYTLSFR